tara:strand:+ start:427 stop:1206 length:780 start_codon:yes stop_codon:yes gene_type:complete
MFISKISGTKLDIIKECLLKYYLRYHEKLPGAPSKNEDALNFGSYIHKIFEDGYKTTDKKKLYKLAEQHKKQYKISYSQTDKTKKCIENFYTRNLKFGRTVGCEYAFNVNLADDIVLNGYIDRIIEGTEGGILILDYKTSKREKNKAELKFNRQLKNYCYAVHKDFNIPISKIVCGHYYPLTDNLVTINYSKGEIATHIKNTVDTVWQIRKRKKTEFPAMQNQFCNWCEYKEICPAHGPAIMLKEAVHKHRIAKKAKPS